LLKVVLAWKYALLLPTCIYYVSGLFSIGKFKKTNVETKEKANRLHWPILTLLIKLMQILFRLNDTSSIQPIDYYVDEDQVVQNVSVYNVS